jgi:hypothetical protein
LKKNGFINRELSQKYNRPNAVRVANKNKKLSAELFEKGEDIEDWLSKGFCRKKNNSCSHFYSGYYKMSMIGQKEQQHGTEKPQCG